MVNMRDDHNFLKKRRKMTERKYTEMFKDALSGGRKTCFMLFGC